MEIGWMLLFSPEMTHHPSKNNDWFWDINLELDKLTGTSKIANTSGIEGNSENELCTNFIATVTQTGKDMPRIERISSDEEGDIWDYRSQTQRPRKTQDDGTRQRTARNSLAGRKQTKPAKSLGKIRPSLSQGKVKTEEGILESRKSQKQKKPVQRKSKVKVERTPNAKRTVDRSGRCPVCQMPFALLSMIETPSWHVDQCLDVPYSSKNECQAGLECNSEIVSHYKKFRHTRLARSRRKNEANEQRDKGDVVSAKTKLSFDTNSRDTKLVVPGSSAECVIVLDSSQDSSFSQRSNHDDLDNGSLSQEDEIDGEQVGIDNNSRIQIDVDRMFGRFDKRKTGTNTDKTRCDDVMSGKKNGKGKIVDKNQNHLEGNKRKLVKQSDKEVFEDDDLVLKTDGENADISAGLTRVETIDLSDDSYGSVEDINDIVDDTRSLSDMINDALNPDDITAAEDSEVDSDKTENDQIIKTRSKLDWNGSDETEVENDNNEDDDPIINLFAERSGKQSAISSLRETPVKSPDSDSSSDWEILKTTLTQPSFVGQKYMEEEIDAKTVLEKISSQQYIECMKTPCKDSKQVGKDTSKVGAKENKRKNETAKKGETVNAEKHKIPQRGFFATKLLQNTHSYYNESVVHVNYADPPCLEEDEDHFDEKEPNTNEQPTTNKQSEENIHQEVNVEPPVKIKRISSGAKRTTRAEVVKTRRPVDTSITALSSDKKEHLTDKDEDFKACVTSSSLGSAKLTAFKSSKEKIDMSEGCEIVEKKPKFEVKPKTPMKRKLGKNIAKKEMVKKENCVTSRQKSAASFFKPKGMKSEQISIQTDSESSGDCERFNKIGNFVKCCAKCTEEQGCWSNYVETVNGLNITSSADASPCTPSQTHRFHGRRNASCTNSSCTSSTCDNLSNCDTCSSCTRSCSSSEATSCRGHGSSRSSSHSNFSGKWPSTGLQSQNNQTKLSNDKNGRQNLIQGCTQDPSCNCSQVSQGQACSQNHYQTGSRHLKCQVCSQQSPGEAGSQQSHFQACSQPNQNQTGSQHTKCQVYSQHSPLHMGSQHNHFQTCAHQSQIGSQHSQGLGSQKKRGCNGHNNSLNNSTCSLQFNIENICTLSQNTYTNVGGGFIPDNSDNVSETVNNPLCANFVNNNIPCSNIASQQNVECSASVSDIEVESIVQIRKSATDILMASSRLLYSKSTKNNTASSGKQKQGNSSTKPSVNEVLMGKSAGKKNQASSNKQAEKSSQERQGWNGARASVSGETSDDANEVKRKCPFYKKIPDTCMTVDAFRYGNIPDCRAYILSHFHYDHYMGLTKRFRNPIYCSKITGNLVKKKIGVDSQFIHTVPLYTPTVVENVEITFLEANHCPGAVLILFKLKSGRVYLHTGDFRACQAMELYPQLQNLRVHTLYLDTTYCEPQYDFPPQEEVIQFTVKLALDTLANNPKTLIVCGSYTIGKERIFAAIAEELDCKICVTRDKKNIIDCMEDEKLKQRVSLQWEDSCLHVIPMNKIKYQDLQEHLLLNGKRYNSVLGIEPTGWTHNKKNLSLYHIKPKVNKDNIKIYGVPYSEHSSFLELKRFVQFTKPTKILPTVNNGNVHSRRKMEVVFEAWMEELQSQKRPTNRQSSITGWTK